MRLFIIANRLPVKVVAKGETYSFARSEGGLATGLDSLNSDMEKHWVGWPGVCFDEGYDIKVITSELEDMKFHPVYLNNRQYEEYYEGYSNSTLWPLCHYFFAFTMVKRNFWQTYREVNELFCDEICKIVRPDDWVWVQDYQLMLLPYMLRKKNPDLHIGYFHHIPFPSYELFRILPEREELLNGLLGADFIAFHTHDYMRHFISAAQRVNKVEFNLDEAQIGNRTVRVDALPMGINYNLYHMAVNKPEVWREVEKNRVMFGNKKLVLSVDRLDYSKGILHRIKGFEQFLENHPEYLGKITLAMVIVPSRDHVDSYAGLKTKIDELIGAVNGRFSTMNWTPVCYFYHGFSFEELAAMYFVADIAMVTPLRDGMNLVAKEYIATKINNPGVLILSEMAGASVEMNGAIHINPNDISQIEQAIFEAVNMPYNEQLSRIEEMQKVISVQTVDKWAADFICEWREVVQRNTFLSLKKVNPNLERGIREIYANSKKRLILLDYDGTLVGFRNNPQDACPDEKLKGLLAGLCNDKRNHVVINSGRDCDTLDSWLGDLPLDFAAEHGAAYKEYSLPAGKRVWSRISSTPEWSEGLLSILNMFVAKTPSSRLEVKKTSLAWHYREVDSWMGELRAQQLVRSVVPMCLQQNLQILQGNKVVEIKSSGYTKGSEVKRLLEKNSYDFILSIGDDTTDEDMFRALPDYAVTVKVGMVSEAARYNIVNQHDVLDFIASVSGIKGNQYNDSGYVFSNNVIPSEPSGILSRIRSFFMKK